MDLDGRRALITGGGTGIGAATAIALARRGCSVALNYRSSSEQAEATAAAVIAEGSEAIAIQGDVANDADCRSMVATAVDHMGGLDVVVNSAGVTVFVDHADLDGVSAEDFHRLLDVNTIGPFQVMRAAAPHLRAARGEVVNISSTSGVAGVGSSIPYCASKAALNNLTVTMARVLAPEVRVNAIAPGFVTGRWWNEGRGTEVAEMVADHLRSTNPLQAVADPEDVARVVVAMVEGPDLTTGQVHLLDGGMVLGR